MKKDTSLAARALGTLPVLFACVNAWYIQKMRSDRHRFGLYARKLYNFDTIVFPAVLGLAGVTVLRNQRSSPQLRKVARAAMAIAGLCGASRIYATHLEPRVLKIEHVRIRTPKIRRRFRILHITDMETDAVRNQELRVLSIAQQLAPDMIVYTGDLMNPIPPATYESEMPKMARLWERVRPAHGKFCVTGEVDQPILSELKSGLGGMTTLNGEAAEVPDDRAGRISIFGLSFEQSCAEPKQRAEIRKAVEQWLESCAVDDFTILAGHRPDFILAIEGLSIDLCLAGHTHGGQVRVPFVGPLATQSQVPDELAMGFHKLGSTRLNVSAGVGFEHGFGVPAIRVNCPPEMTMLELVPESLNAR